MSSLHMGFVLPAQFRYSFDSLMPLGIDDSFPTSSKALYVLDDNMINDTKVSDIEINIINGNLKE